MTKQEVLTHLSLLFSEWCLVGSLFISLLNSITITSVDQGLKHEKQILFRVLIKQK